MKKNFFRLLSVGVASLAFLAGCEGLYNLTGDALREARTEAVGTASLSATQTWVGFTNQIHDDDDLFAFPISFDKAVQPDPARRNEAGTKYALPGAMKLTYQNGLSVTEIVNSLPELDSDADGNLQAQTVSNGTVSATGDFNGTSLLFGALSSVQRRALLSDYKVGVDGNSDGDLDDAGDTVYYNYGKLTGVSVELDGFVSATEKDADGKFRPVPKVTQNIRFRPALNIPSSEVLGLNTATSTVGRKVSIPLTVAEALTWNGFDATISGANSADLLEADVTVALSSDKQAIEISFAKELQNKNIFVDIDLLQTKATDRPYMGGITFRLPRVYIFDPQPLTQIAITNYTASNTYTNGHFNRDLGFNTALDFQNGSGLSDSGWNGGIMSMSSTLVNGGADVIVDVATDFPAGKRNAKVFPGYTLAFAVVPANTASTPINGDIADWDNKLWEPAWPGLVLPATVQGNNRLVINIGAQSISFVAAE